MQALANCVLDEVDEVGAFEAVAASEDEHRVGTLVAGELVDELVTLGVGELTRSGTVLGLGPTVLAHQGTGAGDLPDDEEWFVVEIVLDFAHQRAVAGMPTRVATGGAAWWEVVVSILISVLFSALTIWGGERIYRRSVLKTGGKVKLRVAWRSTDVVA